MGHWHYVYGLAGGYLPTTVEYAGDTADEAIDYLISELDRIADADCDNVTGGACPDPDTGELCEACFALESAKSARADGDYRAGCSVSLRDGWDYALVEPAPDCESDHDTDD